MSGFLYLKNDCIAPVWINFFSLPWFILIVIITYVSIRKTGGFLAEGWRQKLNLTCIKLSLNLIMQNFE